MRRTAGPSFEAFCFHTIGQDVARVLYIYVHIDTNTHFCVVLLFLSLFVSASFLSFGSSSHLSVSMHLLCFLSGADVRRNRPQSTCRYTSPSWTEIRTAQCLTNRISHSPC